MGFWLTSLSGFASLVLIGLVVCVPYVTRWLNRHRSTKIGFRQAIVVHQNTAYLVLAVTVVHMYASMGTGLAARVNGFGLTMATIGLLMILTQMFIGATLRQAEPIGHVIWKRIHWVMMLGIVALIALHISLNGMLTYSII